MLIQQSTTSYPLLFLMVDSTDHITGKTGLTPTVTLCKAGGSFASPAGAVTEIANGWYKVAGNATDSNTLGAIALHASATGADPVDRDIWEVVAFNPQDSVRIGLTALPNAAAEAAGGLYTRGTGAGQINQPANGMVDANTVRWNGTAVATPATAGIPDVNVKNINNVSAASVTTVNANQGTTQPHNFTGTGASALVKSDMVDVAGAAVSTASAQIGVNVVTNGDKTGYALSSAGVQAIWDALTSALTTVGSIGKRLADFVTGDAFVRLGAPAGASVSADIAAAKVDTAAIKVKTDFLPSVAAGAAGGVFIAGTNAATTVTTALTTTFTGNLTGSVASVSGAVGSVTAGVTVTTNNDKTGYGLSSAAVQAIWDALTSALTTVGSIGKLLVDNINATISSRLAAASYTAPLDAAGTRSAVGLASANLDTQLSGINSKTTNLPASPAAVGSAMTLTGAYDAAKTASQAGDAMTLTSGERNSVADAVLKRDWTAVSGEADRSLLNAGRLLRNKWSVPGGVLTVTKEDDSTTAWTAATTSDAAAEPIIGIDPT